MSSERPTLLLRRGTLVAGSLLLGAGVTVLTRHTFSWEFGVGVGLCVFGVGLSLLCLLPPSRHRRGLLVVGSVGVALLLTEVALQLFSPWGQTTIYEVHPRLLHRLIPGSTKIYRRLPENGGESIEVSINSRGFRGPPIADEKQDLRVVVFGDSCVAAEYSGLEETFVARLGTHLAIASGRSVETVNGGVPGYGPDQTLRRMEAELGTLDADLAVVVLFADNDFGDLLRNRIYRIGAAGMLEENGARIPEAIQSEFRFAAVPSAVVQLLLRPPTLVRGAAYELPTDDTPLEEARVHSYLGWCRATYHSAVIERDPMVSTLLADHYDADVSLYPQSESALYKVRLMELVMLEMQRVCARNQVPLVFVLLPGPLDMCDNPYHGRVNRDRFPEYVPTALSDRLHEIAQRHDMRSLNLFPEFWRSGRSSLYFLGDNGHWNDAGQNIAAHLLAVRLVTWGDVLPADPGSDVRDR